MVTKKSEGGCPAPTSNRWTKGFGPSICDEAHSAAGAAVSTNLLW
ncbi:hypothetical protein [Planococcus sp. YIM B11945]